MRKLKRKSKQKEKVQYEKIKCVWRNRFGKGCRNYAVGKSTLCEKHGGKRIEKELMLPSVYALQHIKYDPAVHPIDFLQLSMEGKSVVEIAAIMGIAPGTLKNWSEKFPAFATAWEVGEACHEAWWLTQGKNNLNNTRFQTGLYKFLTTNKLGYAEKIETKSHNINENVGVLLVPGNMSIEEWENKNKKDDGEVIDAEFSETENKEEVKAS